MKKKKRKRRNGLRSEYDLSKLENGVRGKYLARYRAGTNLVLLSPDVAAHFPDEKAVNAALSTLIHASKGTRRRAR
jgi:CRISPR/Cas system-associated endonuclease Cas3-HD